jgi:hypothetical protein
MGKWYDTKITLKKSDFDPYEFRKVSLARKNRHLKNAPAKLYTTELYNYINFKKYYLAACGDLLLNPNRIKKDTKSDSWDIPILVKAAWGGKRRLGIILKLHQRRHWSALKGVKKFNECWDSKICNVVWRGALTGIPLLAIVEDLEGIDLWKQNPDWVNIPRVDFVRKYHKDYNIGFSAYGDRVVEFKSIHKSWKKLLKPSVTIAEQLIYKYIISIEGNDVASGLKWQLLSNSVVLMAKPTKTSWAMEDTLKAYEHYVPLSDSLDNLDEVLQWCRENDSACKQIAENATQYMQQFMKHDREDEITKEIIKRYDKNVSWE